MPLVVEPPVMQEEIGFESSLNANRDYSLLVNRSLSCNPETKEFARLTSHPVRGWTGKNKAFCSPGTQTGCCVIKVYRRGTSPQEEKETDVTF